MNTKVISVENLYKEYRLGVISHGTLSQDLQSWWSRIRGKEDPNSVVSPGRSAGYGRNERFLALKDISFEVQGGEVLGIIGRNGAGKSTLLKILSQVTLPTKGFAKIKGRIASLLEVGTGFHPELTGRENIYLNGAILGMKRGEIQSRFDEIVAFAEIGKFIDTPVKRYSSGMYVRLAFAVAAHLEPEILIVDEVLAVGDAAFQKKCLGKMGKVASGGRTVLFVSHNMQAVRNLCTRSILLDNGEIIADSKTDKTLSVYNRLLRECCIDSSTSVHNETYRRGGGTIRFTSAGLEDINGNKRSSFEMGESIRFVFSYEVMTEMQGIAIYIGLRSSHTRELITTVQHEMSKVRISAGTKGMVTVELPDVYIRPGEYPLYLHISEAVPTKINYDVLDDLTAPLVITSGSGKENDNYNSDSQPHGYFSLPSRLIINEINPYKHQ